MYARSFTLTLLTMSAAFGLAAASSATDQASHAKIASEYLKLPMTFELNEGQTDPQVKALSRGSRYGLFLTSNESVFVVAPGKEESVVRVRTLGSNPAAKVSGVDRLSSVSNYFVGKDQSKWRKGVANYGRVKYDSIYPGIDLIYYGNQQQLEYDYVVAPGADPNSIRLAIEGASKLSIDRTGDLRLETKYGAIYQHKPVIYQQINGSRREIAGSFLLRGNQVSFKLGNYDHSQELVIDPSLAFSTYLGGSGTDSGKAITITTGTGLTLVAGSTASANFPIVPVPLCPATPVCTTTGVTSYSYTGETDGFLAVFNAGGTKLYNSTYIGGTGGANVVTSVAIDNFEVPAIMYVAGYTTSTDFDVVNAAQPTSGGGVDAWVSGVLLDLTIDTLVPPTGTINTSIGFATYLGGSGTDEITSIAMDPATKDLFVTGFTTSSNFPIVVGTGAPGVVQNTFSGTEDAFVARYASGCNAAMQNIDGCTLETTPAGTLLFSTYLGGTGTTVGNGIAVGINPVSSKLTAYLVGTTNSTTLGEVEKPSTEPAVSPAVTSDSEAFVVSMTQLGAKINFTAFVGSSTTSTVGNAITLDVSGDIYITGDTNDSALTLVNPIFKHYQGDTDVFVGEYGPGGATRFLTYYGGAGFDEAFGIGVCTITTESTPDCASAPGGAGTTSTTNLFIGGETTGSFYITSGAPQTVYGGGPSDGFVAMLTSTDAASSSPLPKWTIGYSSYMGGPGTDIIYGLAVGSSGNARVTGLTNSTTGMATTGAYQTTSGGGYDAFVAEILTTP
jgi:hypothetical protein